MAARRPCQLGAGGDGELVEPLELRGDGRQRQLGQRPEVGLGADVESAGPARRGPRRSPAGFPRRFAVQLADQRPGPDHVLLGAAGREPFAGDRPEVLQDLAVLGQDLLDLQARVEVVIGALHGGDGVELGGGQLGQGDLNVRSAASPRSLSVPNHGNCCASVRL